jgi:hypothetical protein
MLGRRAGAIRRLAVSTVHPNEELELMKEVTVRLTLQSLTAQDYRAN